ncbi:MAG: hypothetical protein ACI4R9_00220 [Kiritimatiellia bacterium]
MKEEEAEDRLYIYIRLNHRGKEYRLVESDTNPHCEKCPFFREKEKCPSVEYRNGSVFYPCLIAGPSFRWGEVGEERAE